jgi:hypothetical protein
LANNLVRAGMRVVQTIGVPDAPLPADCNAVVIALKSRTIAPVDAVAQSLDALHWLLSQKVKQVYFKYCSTFDSWYQGDIRGNIGPVTEALMQAMGCDFTIATPAFPDNQRTVFKGHLFVGDVLLSDSGMKNHPLTPMQDANLVNVLQAQCTRRVGLIEYRCVAKGSEAIVKRITELKAQGIGNIIAGLIGGIPMTSVIVRTSANVNAGARTKFSAIVHGFFLLLAVILIPNLLNKIPMACLASILIVIGFKLASPSVFKHMWQAGKFQFIPFLVTAIAVVTTDLLKGVGIGLLVSVFFILKGNMKLAYFFKKKDHHDGETIIIDLAQEVSFLNKAAIKETLRHLPENSKVIINAENTVYIDYDVLELIKDFIQFSAKDKNINVDLNIY